MSSLVPESPDPASTAGRIVRLMEAVATSHGDVGIRSLARETGIDRSTASRLLRQLGELGIVAAGPADGRWVVGPRLQAVARAVAAPDVLVDAARGMLERLASRFGETGCLGEFRGSEIVYRYVVESSRPLRYVVPVGIAAPLHAGAGGRAILATISPEAADEYLTVTPLAEVTPATVTDRTQLREMLAHDRETGYSISHGERFAGGCAVGSGFRWANGSCGGSIVLAFPISRLDEHDLSEMSTAVRAAADELSARLGFDGDA